MDGIRKSRSVRVEGFEHEVTVGSVIDTGSPIFMSLTSIGPKFPAEGWLASMKVSRAFWPVTAIAWHLGIVERRAGMSVGRATSRNLSEALPLKRLTAEAVSNKAIPFSLQKAMTLSLSMRFRSVGFGA